MEKCCSSIHFHKKIRKYGELLKEEYTPEGIYVEAYVPPEL